MKLMITLLKGILIPMPFILAFFLSAIELNGQSQSFTTPGASTFTVPAGVTTITVQVWGGGGRGGSRTTDGEGGGGGGGGFSKKDFSVTPGAVYNLFVGSGSTSGTSPGGDSWFDNNTVLLARGGNSVPDNTTTGASGALAGIGDVTYTGGAGRTANTSGTNAGGGGSSAGTAANGVDATSTSGAIAPPGGGNGGNGATNNNQNGSPGSVPGGGGGGADKNNPTNRTGGSGANGKVTVIWCANFTAVLSGTNSICEGSSSNIVVTISAGGTSPYTVVYNDGSMDHTVNNYTSGSNISVTPSMTTTYTLVSVTDANGCTATSSGSATVTVNPNVNAGTVSGTTPLCVGQMTTFTSNGDAGGTWSSTNTSVATVNATTGVVTAINDGTTNITYTISSGCGSPASAFQTLTVNLLPNNTSNGFTGSTICNGDNGTLTFDAVNSTFVAPYSISYTDGVTTWSQSIASSMATTFNVAVNPTVTTTYTLVSITNGNGCTRTSGFGDASAQIVVRPTPTATISGNNTVCTGDPSPNITFMNPQSLAVTIAYNINGGPNATINVNGNSSATVPASTAIAGVYNYNLVSVAYQSTPNCTTNISGTATITVNEAPAFTSCPNDLTVTSDPGACDAVVTYSTTVTGTPAPLLSYSFSGATSGSGSGNGSGQAFNTGVTVVNITASNSCSPDDVCSFEVTVEDDEDPEITCPSNVNQTADPGDCGAAVTIYSPVTSDNCPGETAMNDYNGTSDASDTYPVGTTTVVWTVEDGNRNTSSCSMTVTITDDEDPEITCPSSVNQTADPGACGAAVTVGSPITSDNCLGETATNDYNGTEDASDTYPVGTTIVVWTVVDASGNTSSCSMTVTISDDEDPQITCPSNVNQTADPGNCGAAVTVGSPVTSDNCPGETATNDYNGTADASDTYPVGTTTIIWTVEDASGNTSSCSMTVTITDDEDPEITCPSNVNQTADPGDCSAAVTVGSPVTSDNCSGETATNDYNGTSDASDTYPVGTTTVVWTVEDASGNTSSCSMTVTITDDEDPEITCPSNVNQTADPGECGAGVTVDSPLTSDNCLGEAATNDYNGTADASDTYPVGTTIVVWTVEDASGNTSSCSMTVTIIDDEDPEITCPSNVNQTADPGACGAAVTVGSPVTSDNCPGETATNDYNGTADASDTYPVSTTTVVWTVEDASGNTSSCSMTVTITDDEDPEITCPSNVNQTADPGDCGAAVAVGSPVTSDNCTGETATNDYNGTSDASDTYPVGTTTVVWTVEDASGNTSSCSMTVTITDNEDPEITCPSNVNQTADPGECGAAVTVGSPVTSDNCSGETATNDYNGTADASDTYPVGTTIVVWTVVDANGNTSFCSMTVTITDDEDPEITCPSNVNQTSDPGECGAAVTVGSPITSDNCTGETATNDYNGTADASDTYPVGTTIVVWTVEDASGNTSSCSMNVTITDDEDPEITCPSNINQTADPGACGSAVTVGSPITSDNCLGETVMNDYNGTADASDTYPVGTTIVVWTVEDASGNTSSCSMTVIITDDEDPEITCPANVNQTADLGECGAAVTVGSPVTSDNCPGQTATNDYNGTANASDTYPVGTTIVVWTVEDAHGNTSACSMSVTITDDENPEITCPSDINQTADPGDCGALISFEATASDNCNAIVSYSQDPGTFFPVGTTIVTATATDGAGNTAECTFQVIVIDDEDPSISCPANFSVPYDPATCTSVSVPDPLIDDNCEVSKLTWTMSGATTGSSPSEGINLVGSQILGFGTTTIMYEIEDIHGNMQSCSFDVTVTEGVTTSTIAVEPATQQYSDKVTFTATITDGASNCGPQAAEEATFYIGVQNMGSAPFLPSGANLVATLSNVPLVEGVVGQMSPGVKTVSAIFSGIDAHYNVSQPSNINLTISKENANVEYNGLEYFSTPNQNNCTGIVTLSSYVEDVNDGCPGDIRNSTVTFYRDVVGGTVLGTPDLPVGLVNPANLQEGIAITDFTHTLTGSNCSSGGETFEVWASAGNYYMGSTPEATLVTLALPGNEFVTGGGHLVMEQSEGAYAATDGSKMNFGFNMKWNPSGNNLQGKINIIFRRWIEYQNVWQWRTYQIKSNKINSMAVDESDPDYRKAIISTKANLTDVTDPLIPVSLGGNLNLAMNAWESTVQNNGSLDKIAVTLTGNGNQGLLFSSYWESGNTIPQLITGGKIKVRSEGGGQNLEAEQKSVSPVADKLIRVLPENMEVIEEGENYLLHNIPNPFNDFTTIPVYIQENSSISLKVFNSVGELITVLHEGELAPGKYSYPFTPYNLSDGIYYYSLSDGKKVVTKRMVYIR